ncbi:MAG: DegT/DnrJ/EryC1/StrS aminotransferase family protein [Lachnospiraceae bacterium]|nr:DegT/DnrJ/EryC1/StrS aminotransferase family protein [Lachnospiraceae bacterium]
MEQKKIIFSPPDISEAEIEEVCAALRSGWLTTGPRTKELERQIAEYLHTPKAVALNSATAAEELNLRILGIGEGDEVLVPAYTYTATAAAALHVGADIRFIDCQENSLEMDYEQMENAITEKTKAVIPVDLGGIPCDYEKIYEIAERKKGLFVPGGNTELGQRIQKALGRVAVVSDSAHSFGASRKEKMAGTLADFSSFSFHAVKNFTTAEGGAAVWNPLPGIDDEELYRWYQLYSLHGQSKDALAKTQLGSWEYDIVAPLYKCNMTDVAAAIGLKQMERYPALLERRKQIIAQYDAACDAMGVEHLIHDTEEYASSRHLYLSRIPWADDALRREVIVKMAERGIPCNVHYKPLPMMTAYRALGFDIKDYPNAYAHFANEVTLPLHTLLSDEDVAYIAKNYQEVLSATKHTG